MKLAHTTSPTFASDGIARSKMGMTMESADLITSYLRDKIYSDKKLACIRETITNAVDEHTKYGILKPVEVKMVRVDGMIEWSVRDFAKGLSEDDVRNIYGMYGGSTKRNDNKQIGGFGIGALSPFAVVDTFYVTSHFDGVKSLYVCSLGAGTSGISVGEIYKFSEEPTTETGIEVKIELPDNYETNAFHSITEEFVLKFNPNVNLQYSSIKKSTVTTPIKPSHVYQRDGYTFNLYTRDVHPFNNYYHRIAYRMGGVVYKTDSIKYDRLLKGFVIVDIPIGKVTIPISREDMEDTVANNKVFAEIRTIMESMYLDDTKSIKVPKFADYFLSKDLSYGKTYETDWFTHRISDMFPNSWKLRNAITQEYYSLYKPQVNKSGQRIVYLMPDIKNFNHWVKRMNHFMTNTLPNTAYSWMRNSVSNVALIEGNHADLDLSDVTFIDIKSLKLPKLPSTKRSEAFYMYRAGRKMGPYTPEEFEEKITNGADIDPEWYKTVTTLKELDERSIGQVKEWGTYRDFYTTNSVKMTNALTEMGWLSVDSDEYSTKSKEIRDKMEEMRKFEQTKNSIRSYIFNTKPNKKAISLISKKPNKTDRYRNFYHKVIAENSSRGRILKTITNGYSNHMNREDLRRILQMKDQ